MDDIVEPASDSGMSVKASKRPQPTTAIAISTTVGVRNIHLSAASIGLVYEHCWVGGRGVCQPEACLEETRVAYSSDDGNTLLECLFSPFHGLLVVLTL